MIHSASAKNQSGVWEALDALIDHFEIEKSKPTDIVFKYENTDLEN